jgi:hypothetical protein
MPAHTHGPGNLTGFTGSVSTSSAGAHQHDYVRYDNTVNRASGGSGNFWDGDATAQTSSAGTHSHTVPALGVAINLGATSSTGSGGSHSHNMDIRVRYADAIRATKN